MKSICLSLLAFVTLAAPLVAQQIQVSKDNKTIAITTSDESSALADTAIVNIGFTTYGKDQDSTYADASRISNAIFGALTTAGVPKDDIQSSNQSISQLNQNSTDDKARFAAGLRFQFSQSWRVTVAAAQASNILHLAITSGADESGNIQWQLKNDDALEAEAAAKALEHARQIAEQMAKGLGVHLGPLIYASNQQPSRFIDGFVGGQLVPAPMMARSKAANLQPLAITPERIIKSATVYAVFSVE